MSAQSLPPPAADPADRDDVATPPSQPDNDHDGQGSAAPSRPIDEQPARGMIPARIERRTKFERASMRMLATGGILGIATILGAVLVSQHVAGWIVGLAVGLTSVILAAVLWSSRQL